MQPPHIDISPAQWDIVRGVLRQRVPHNTVWAFGSRATWTAKPFSDLDLAILTDQPLDLAVSAALAEDFSESDLPFKVDVVDWATTSESFRRIIERDKVVLQTGGVAAATQPRNPLHGVTLEAMVTALSGHYGWSELGQRIPVRCFTSDPSIKSSLSFLRKTPWARAKVESLYLFMLREQRRNQRGA